MEETLVTESTLKCHQCGHEHFVVTTRMAALLPMVGLIMVVIATAIGMAIATALGFVSWYVALGSVGLSSLPLSLPYVAPRWYWGGMTCSGCHLFSMYR